LKSHEVEKKTSKRDELPKVLLGKKRDVGENQGLGAKKKRGSVLQHLPTEGKVVGDQNAGKRS